MATLEQYTGSNKIYLNIIKGAFRQKVAEGTEGATIRELVDKNGKPTGETRTELVYNKLTGQITDIYFKELPFGDALNIEFDNEIIISLMTNKEEFKDFANKLPLIDINSQITLIPYEMDIENKNPKTKKDFPTRKKRGLVIKQDGKKIEGSAYVKYDADKKEFSYNGNHPVPNMEKAKKMGSKYWKSYFPDVEYFLTEEVKKVADNFTKIDKIPGDEKLTGNNNSDISVDDLPF